MANTPKLRSREQIIGDIVDGILARLKTVNDLNPGSTLTQFTEAIGQSQFKATADIIQMIDALSIDRAEGEALQRLARDRNVPILPALPSSGRLTVTDLSFTKVQTTVYSGQPAPVAGTLTIYVTDASKFNTAGGKIYLGRGTPNVEGPLDYTSVQPEAGGAYWSITLSPSSPTTKFHNIGETVVFGQGGNRTIPSGTVCQTAQGNATQAVKYSTTGQAVIIDGETEVTDVSVVCQSVGPIGNVPRGAIKDVLGLPFQAVCFNDQPYSNGRDADNEDQIRSRIKAYEQAKSKGTEVAIQLSALDVVSPDELKRVQSSSISRYADGSAALVFDDGTGYEPIFTGIGIEQVVDSAIGGEKELQIRSRPIALARVESNVPGPYAIANFSNLSVTIAGVTKVHQFKDADFKVPGNGTPDEVAASINGNPNIHFLAGTSRGRTRVVIYPRSVTQNDIQVNVLPTDDANSAIGFPINQEFTARLYKNDLPLYQDGLYATVKTRSKPTWSTSIAAGDTLIYTVEHTPPVTVTFSLQDFQAVDPTATVSYLTDINIWAQVFNNKMPGMTAVVNSEVIEITSNKGRDNNAYIEIVGGTLKDKIFEPDTAIFAEGRKSDYTLNRQTAQLSLVDPLVPGDSVTLGSPFTRAKVTTTPIPSGTTSAGRLWFVLDGAAKVIPNNLQPSTKVSFSKPSPDKLLIHAESAGTMLPEGFDQVQVGDWLLVWANPADDTRLVQNQIMLRVESVEVGNIIVDTPDGVPTTLFTAPADRFVFVRSDAPMQRLEFPLTTLSGFVSTVEQQLDGVNVDIVGSQVRISTKTAGANGEMLVVAADNGGKNLGVPVQTIIQNIPSHLGFVNTSDSEAGIPSFTHSALTGTIDDNTFLDPSYLDLGGTEDDFMQVLDRYDASAMIPVRDSDRLRRVFLTKFDPVTNEIEAETPSYMRSGASGIQPSFDASHPVLVAGDRYFLRTSYQFDSNDSATIIVDGDTETQSYYAPVARKVIVNGHSAPTTQAFSADDGESSLALNDAASFAAFDFTNFKVWRQAAAELTNGDYDILIKSADFGPSGNRIRVGFIYPDSINTQSLTTKVTTSDIVDVGVVIPVTNPRSQTWDGTTAFTVDVTTINGRDEVKYTYRVGTNPGVLFPDEVPGDVVIINGNSDFLPENRGYSAKLKTFSNGVNPSFTVDRVAGQSVSDNVLFQSMQNQPVSGVPTITVVSVGPHNVQNGDRVGIWDTVAVSGSFKPMETTYIATVINATTFTVPTPAGTPGGVIQAGSHAGNLVTITATNHGLAVGNIILISGVSSGSYNGLAAVSAVLSANQFQYVRSGSSASIANTGRFDFQSYGAGVASTPISSISRAIGGEVTVNSTAHGLNPGDIVQVLGPLDFSDWSNVTAYAVGDVVEYSGTLYKSIIAGNTGNQPDISPAQWSIVAAGYLTGIFIVKTATVNSFTYDYNDVTGVASATGGSATKYTSKGRMARCIGINGNYLAIGEVKTTAQEVADYITQSIPDLLQAVNVPVNPQAVIDTSTEDEDIGSDYIYGNITSMRQITGMRLVEINVDTNVPAGATIRVDVSNAAYDDTYVILSSTQTSPTSWKLTAQSRIVAYTTGTISGGTGTFAGSVPFIVMKDGENSVLSQDLASLPGNPQFTMKHPWSVAPRMDEEIRLMATNADQLSRFWNTLIVTGLSNVAKVENSEYGRQIQVTTNKFGSTGSIQIAGGYANAGTVALIGSASSVNDKVGVFQIPYELRKGLNARQWIRLQQTVRQNKIIGLEGTSTIRVYNDGIELDGVNPGSFQTKRPVQHDNTTRFKIEKHGSFIAYIHVAGTSPAIGQSGVQEGDWVRLKDVDPATHSTGVSWPAGSKVISGIQRYVALQNVPVSTALSNTLYWQPYNDYSIASNYNTSSARFVYYAGRVWEAVAANGPSTTIVEPGTDVTVWQPREWGVTNQGIFKIVRTFGDGSFWIENENAIEEITQVLDPRNMSFYSYDSIMPGDTLDIKGNILGVTNVGRYVVQDDDVAQGYSFPTATRIWTTPIPQDSGGNFIILGDSFNLVTIEEDEPVSLLKRVLAVGPGPSNSLASVITDTPNLMNKISNSLGAYFTMYGKLGMDTSIHYGIDGYKYFQGLIAQLNRVIYGDPSNPLDYPGVRAAGTNVDIKEAIRKRIGVALTVRIRTGIPFSEVRDRIKTAVAGYVNTLGVGEQVSLSQIVAAAGKVNGVISVAITSPTYDAANDLIAVGADEKAFVADPTTDVVVSISGG